MINRKAFNFFRSYWETGKMLDDKNRLAFYDAIFEKQFNDKEIELTGMANFAYITQKFNINSQVEGYKTKIGNGLTTPTTPPCLPPSVGGTTPPCLPPSVQEKEKGKVKEKVKEKENVNENSEFSEIKNQLTDEIWKETFCINSGITSETFDLKMDEFLKSIQITGEYKEKNMIDLKSHFLNIIKKTKTESKPKPKYLLLTKEESFKVQISPNDHAVWLNDEKTKWQRTGIDEKGEYVLLKGEKNYLN